MPKKGEIVLAAFPFTDLSADKVRPAVIIADQEKNDDVIVAFISSQLIFRDKTEVLIEKASPEFSKTGLKVDSVIRLRKIAAIDKKIILGKLGAIGPNVQKEINKGLKTLFGLN